MVTSILSTVSKSQKVISDFIITCSPILSISMIVPDTDLEAPTTPTGSQRLASGDVEEAKSSLVAESASKKEMRRRKKAANILDIPWTAPDWQKAKKYADYVQPRKGGKGGTRFDYNETTTGRHCCIGGLGEQFDLWQEGQISEFSIYGSGVTNYFKFIKWCFWLFFVLAVLSLPQLILNIYGPDKTNSGLKELASTTVGNLAENIANTTVSITIPGCTGYGVFNVDCNFDRDSLAAFYMYLEIIISGTIFIAYIWLRVFEKQEEKALDKNTVNASMFTLCISRIPEDTTEEELASHFQKLLRNESAVATVCIAYDNADEIRECTARGDIIRAKVRLVHVSLTVYSFLLSYSNHRVFVQIRNIVITAHV